MIGVRIYSLNRMLERNQTFSKSKLKKDVIMKNNEKRREVKCVSANLTKRVSASFLGAALALSLTAANLTAAEARVFLGSVAPFAVLAGSTVTNVISAGTTINGDHGVWAGTAVTGFPPGVGNGTIHAGDAAAQHAQASLTIAPSLYKSTSSLEISSGDFYLDGQGNKNAVWIFQMASTRVTTSGRRVILIGNAQAGNVFWMATGATMDGRVLARIGAVTLDSNVVTLQKVHRESRH